MLKFAIAVNPHKKYANFANHHLYNWLIGDNPDRFAVLKI